MTDRRVFRFTAYVPYLCAGIANLQLDGAHLEVTSDLPPASSILPTNASASTPIGAKTDSEGHILQEDKPKVGLNASQTLMD